VRIAGFSGFAGETLRDVNSATSHYLVATIASTIPSPSRSFTGRIMDLTWLGEEGPCLYVGDSHAAGPIRAVNLPSKVNDDVIEGAFSKTTYRVSGPFDDNFIFGMFDQSMCVVPHIY
jgi:hypothetical protein